MKIHSGSVVGVGLEMYTGARLNECFAIEKFMGATCMNERDCD
jgi:hypothetical protein